MDYPDYIIFRIILYYVLSDPAASCHDLSDADVHLYMVTALVFARTRLRCGCCEDMCLANSDPQTLGAHIRYCEKATSSS